MERPREHTLGPFLTVAGRDAHSELALQQPWRNPGVTPCIGLQLEHIAPSTDIRPTPAQAQEARIQKAKLLRASPGKKKKLHEKGWRHAGATTLAGYQEPDDVFLPWNEVDAPYDPIHWPVNQQWLQTTTGRAGARLMATNASKSPVRPKSGAGVSNHSRRSTIPRPNTSVGWGEPAPPPPLSPVVHTTAHHTLAWGRQRDASRVKLKATKKDRVASVRKKACEDARDKSHKFGRKVQHRQVKLLLHAQSWGCSTLEQLRRSWSKHTVLESDEESDPDSGRETYKPESDSDSV